jgi:hypothetical protein
LILLGALTNWLEPQAPLPRFLGWTLLAFAMAGIVLMPVSDFWLLLPPAVGILVRRGLRGAAGGIIDLELMQAEDGFSRRRNETGLDHTTR